MHKREFKTTLSSSLITSTIFDFLLWLLYPIFSPLSTRSERPSTVASQGSLCFTFAAWGCGRFVILLPSYQPIHFLEESINVAFAPCPGRDVNVILSSSRLYMSLIQSPVHYYLKPRKSPSENQYINLCIWLARVGLWLHLLVRKLIHRVRSRVSSSWAFIIAK